MDQEAQPIKLTELAGESSLIDEPLEYILTPEEEQTIVAVQIRDMVNRAYVDMMGVGLTKSEAEARIAETDWASKIDKEALFKRSNSNKHYQLWEKSQRQAERDEADRKAQELKEQWTANRFLSLLRYTSENRFGKTLIVNDNTLPLIRVACYFLSSDKRFETDLKLSLNKGLYLRGDSGRGKTHVFECLKRNKLQPIAIFSMIEITQQVSEEGKCVLSAPGHIIYLDDVGSESTPVMFYKNEIHWFKDFIELWYAKKLPFSNLMISTNLSKKQIEEKYGYRVRSRMEEMFNIINVEGEDMRK